MVFGTRPEAIKMCPLVKVLMNRSSEFDVRVCVTGQHRDMLDAVLGVFGIVPDYDLDIMKTGQTLFEITESVLGKMHDILMFDKPDIVLVHGDTTTSFAAGLSSFYLGIPVGHVEAGLRTWNIKSPFPEEFNRQAVDSLSDYFFAPTETSKNHLLGEGKDEKRIYVTGNTGIDALSTTIKTNYRDEITDWLSDRRLLLLTAHRRENQGQPMRQMFRAIRRVVEMRNDTCVLYPVHPNPIVKEIAQAELTGSARIKLVDPLDVITFHNILAKSYIVLTDSGGIQEEAPSLGKPVLVMRDTTERPEGVEAGTLRLVGTSESNIVEECLNLLDNQDAYRIMAKASNPYGDGHASERIADALVEHFKR